MITWKHIVPMALILAGVAGCVTTSGQSNVADINAHVIGNTVVGVDDGKPYQEYYNPNGTIEGMDTEEYTGSWRIMGTKLCTNFPPDDDTKTTTEPAWTCSGVSVNGDTVTWIDDEGERSEAKLLPGKQIEPQAQTDQSAPPVQPTQPIQPAQ